MTTIEGALPTAVDLADILSETCDSLLGPTPTLALADGLHLRAAVTISGGWDGAVAIDCSVELARWFAAQLFQIPGENIQDGDIADTLGELANIVGGAVKAMIPQPSALSLPFVSDMAEPQRPDANASVSASIDIGGQLLTAVIWASRSPLTRNHIDETRNHHANPDH